MLLSIASILLSTALPALTNPLRHHASGKAHITVPLTQHRGPSSPPPRIALSLPGNLTIDDIKINPRYVYANLTVGDSRNLSLIVDTGSADLALNPDVYVPSPASRDLGEKATIRYIGGMEFECNLFTDTVSISGLVAAEQTIGAVIHARENVSLANRLMHGKYKHDGIVGFAGWSGHTTRFGGFPFFPNLCQQEDLPECRVGVALGMEGEGTLVLGGVEEELFDGELVPAAPSIDKHWFAGSIAVNANGRDVLTEQGIVVDTGSANIMSSKKNIRRLFAALNITAITEPFFGSLLGVYPCDSHPQVGFRFGSRYVNGEGSTVGKVFNIEPSAMEQARLPGGLCVSPFVGSDQSEDDWWLVGLPWIAGKYVDFEFEERAGAGRVSVAMLKNGSGVEE